ncbi:uncharacterized protein [Scyliorhinus torazame]|uniref:uncharacterized protein n=1 Tax=Scyliorhinus torazame TaxID=75743 RepID=UPI003B58C5A1
MGIGRWADRESSFLAVMISRSTYHGVNWKLFKQRFQLFLEASDGKNASDTRKIALLLSTAGQHAIHIYNSLAFAEGEDKTKYKMVLLKFDEHFSVEVNESFERYLFQQRLQATARVRRRRGNGPIMEDETTVLYFYHPQWWTLDIEHSLHHVTLAYDRTGQNRELEDKYRPLIGTEWPVKVTATVTGKEGTADFVTISPHLWPQSASVSLHISRQVHDQYHARDLGQMVRRAVDHSDPTEYALQVMPDGTAIKYFEVPETINTRLQHHWGHDVLEYVNPQVWAKYPSQVGKTNVTPIKVTIKDHVKLPSIRQYPLKSQAAPSIDKLIQELLQQGILVPCQSECNTPILAVPKPAKPDQYRLVQDLRSINAIA